MTEEELYKNELRMRKYKKVKEFENHILEQKEVLLKNRDIILKSEKCLDSKHNLYSELRLSLGPNDSSAKKLITIRTSYGPLTDNIGEFLLERPITRKEDKYLRVDMTTVLIDTALAEYDKTLERIAKFKEYILNCTDKELEKEFSIEEFENKTYTVKSLKQEEKILNKLNKKKLNKKEKIKFRPSKPPKR